MGNCLRLHHPYAIAKVVSNTPASAPKRDVPIAPVKDRLSRLQARVTQRVTERDDLVEQGRRPHVTVVREPQPDVLLAIQVAGDRRDRPSPLGQSMRFHVFSLCDHDGRVPPDRLA
jgi:hypothetical protein